MESKKYKSKFRKVQDLNSVQLEIVNALRDTTCPDTCWKTFIVKKHFNHLTPFLTFPGPKVCVQMDYSRQTRKERLSHAQQDWVLKNTFGHDVYRISTVAYEQDPFGELKKLVSYLWERGKDQMSTTEGEKEWADELEKAMEARRNEKLDPLRHEEKLLEKIRENAMKKKTQDLRNALLASRTLRGQNPWTD